METYKGDIRVNKISSFNVISYEYTYKWVCENFSNYISTSNELSVFESDFFNPEPDICWKIRILMESGMWRTCLLRGSYANIVDLHWKLSVLDGNNKILYEKSMVNYLGYNTDRVYHSLSKKTFDEINKTKSSEIVTLVIYLKIFKSETKTLFGIPSDAQFFKDVQQSFSEGLVKMYDDQSGTDITLKVQDETVGAHKVILSARSPVFAKMFQQELAESKSQVVDIVDIEISTLKELLAFIYSGKRRDYDFETALDVYYAADKYEVGLLKEMCGSVLISRLNSENVIKLLQLADRHSDTVLKNNALQFLRLYFTKCVLTESWSQFQSEKSELYSEVVEYMKN